MRKLEHKEFDLVEDNVKVYLSWIGEEYEGEPILRLDIGVHDSVEQDCAEENGTGWSHMSDSSYCTGLSFHLDDDFIKDALRYIMEQVKEEVLSNNSIKRICENLSGLSKETVEEWKAL